MEKFFFFTCGVAIRHSEGKSFTLAERKTDKNGRILLLDVIIHEQNFVLVNLYNANTERNQLNTIDELREMLKSVNNINAKQIILSKDFNLYSVYFDSFLGNEDKNPILKKNIAKMIELNNTFELSDIWRLRNTKTKKILFGKIIGLALFNVDWTFLFQIFYKSLFTKQMS